MADTRNMVVKAGQAERYLPYAEIACAATAAGLWMLRPGLGPWPLALLGVGWLSRLRRGRSSLRPSALDVAVWLWVASAALGASVAYNSGSAWDKFWLVVGAAGVYDAVSHQPRLTPLYPTLALFGLFGVAVSIYFFGANDWTTPSWAAHSAKVAWLVRLGQHLAALLPRLGRRAFTPDTVASVAAMLAPLYVGLAAMRPAGDRDTPRSRGEWVLAVGWTIAGFIALLPWLVSTSYGAWLAVAGVVTMWAVWRGLSEWGGSRLRALRLPVLVCLALCAVLGVFAVYQFFPGRLPGAGELAGRASLAGSALQLARDYVFTGAGLSTFSLQYSIYTLLIHVGYIDSSRNILLDMWIEQGVLGLLAFAGLIAGTLVAGLRRLQSARGNVVWVLETGLASLGVMLLNGLLNDAVYSHRAIVILLVPLGLVAAARANSAETAVEDASGHPAANRRLLLVPGTALVLVLVVLIWRDPLRAAWYANIGALEQSRVELRVYDPEHFGDPTLDQVRRQENLNRAIGWLSQAVSIDPQNPTARQRLAEIALSRGQYDESLKQMQSAWDAGHRDPVTRMLLGDAYVANGRVDEAVALVRGLPGVDGRFSGQAWYRYEADRDYIRAADAWTAVSLLKPDDPNVKAQAEAARRAVQTHPQN